MTSSKPYAKLKYRNVKGSQIAYIDEGDGDAIVFQHGQPTSSYVWRNVLPYLEGMGRLIACDFIGMGGSDKLDPSLGPDRYSLANHRIYLFDLWDQLDLGDRVVLVLDDWGAVLGFDWARRNSHRVQGIVHMEAIAAPLDGQISRAFASAVHGAPLDGRSAAGAGREHIHREDSARDDPSAVHRG